MSAAQFSLPKSGRIVKKAHFSHFFANSRRYGNSYVNLYVAPAYDHSPKVAFVAGKKLGNAVIRNKCRRRLREIYRINQSRIHNGMDLVFVAKRTVLDVPFSAAEKAVVTLCRGCLNKQDQ